MSINETIYGRLPYTTTVPSSALHVTKVQLLCRGIEEALHRAVEGTPFTLADDVYVVSFTDRRTADYPLFDFSVTLQVEYEGVRGGYPVVVIESSQRMVLGGREKWGYPKVLADMEGIHKVTGSSMMATVGETQVVRCEWEKGPVSRGGDNDRASAVAPAIGSPHFLLRPVLKPNMPGLERVDVLTRNVSADFVTRSVEEGGAVLRFQAFPSKHIAADFPIVGGLAAFQPTSVLTAERFVGDWFSTERNGWARRA